MHFLTYFLDFHFLRGLFIGICAPFKLEPSNFGSAHLLWIYYKWCDLNHFSWECIAAFVWRDQPSGVVPMSRRTFHPYSGLLGGLLIWLVIPEVLVRTFLWSDLPLVRIRFRCSGSFPSLSLLYPMSPPGPSPPFSLCYNSLSRRHSAMCRQRWANSVLLFK